MAGLSGEEKANRQRIKGQSSKILMRFVSFNRTRIASRPISREIVGDESLSIELQTVPLVLDAHIRH